MAVTPPLRWKKLECIVCNGTGLRGRLARDFGTPDKPCLACDGDLAMFVSEKDEVAAHPSKPVAGTWGGKFALLEEAGVPDYAE